MLSTELSELINSNQPRSVLSFCAALLFMYEKVHTTTRVCLCICMRVQTSTLVSSSVACPLILGDQVSAELVSEQ